jgi:hypothetical protein
MRFTRRIGLLITLLQTFCTYGFVVTGNPNPPGRNSTSTVSDEYSFLSVNSCTVAPLKSWTPQEVWVWGEICQGKAANFNSGGSYGGWLHPGSRSRWPQNRILRPSFLQTILLIDPYQRAASIRGVTIIGAWFPDSINLANTSLTADLLLQGCRFDSPVNLAQLKSSRSISFPGSRFFHALQMDSIEVTNNLVMNSGAEFEQVILTGAKIGGQASLILSRFNQKLNMNALEVKSSLFLDSRPDQWIQTGLGLYIRGYRAKVSEIDLVGAQIGAQLTMDRSVFEKPVNMESITVQKQVLMNDGAVFHGINLRSATVGSLSLIGSLFKKPEVQSDETRKWYGSQNLGFSVNLANVHAFENINIGRGSTFEGKLTLNSIITGQSAFMTQSRFRDVELTAAKIGQTLDMSNSEVRGLLDTQLAEIAGDLSMAHTKVEGPTLMMMNMKIGGNLTLADGNFPSINLTNSSVTREFVLGQKNSNGEFPAKWKKDAVLVLRNVSVGFLQDLRTAWPNRLELNGFTYSLGGLVLDNEDEMALRDPSWFQTWLLKQNKYSPDVYEQLANALKKLGYRDKALDIQYAGKERERNEAIGWNHTWLSVLDGAIGYGIGARIWRVFRWVGVFVIIGFLAIFLFEGTATEKRDLGYGFPYAFAILIYSFVTLVPLISLDDEERKLVKSNAVRYYFYLHRIAGYVLTTFIIAGLAGITK